MPDDERTVSESAVDTASPPSVESAPEAPRRFPNLNAVYAGVSKDVDDDDDDEPDEDGTEQPAGGDTPASTPEPAPAGAQSSATPKLSRREQREQARQAEIETARQKATQAEQALTELQTQHTRLQQEAIASLGNDEQFSKLHDKYEAFKKIGYEPESYMDVDELSEYQRLLPQRQHAAVLMDLARQSLRANDQTSVTSVVKEFGLEPAQYVGVDPAVAIKNAIVATEARVRQESADRIAQLEASEKSLSTKLAGKSKDIGPGGRSDTAVRRSGPAFDPQRSPFANLNDAFAQPAGGNGRGDT